MTKVKELVEELEIHEMMIGFLREIINKTCDLHGKHCAVDARMQSVEAFLSKITDCKTELEKLEAEKNQEWADKPDYLTPQIDAYHPLKTGDHKTREEANLLVSNRHSKGSLIDLVNYLLKRNKELEAENAELKETLESILDNCFLKKKDLNNPVNINSYREIALRLLKQPPEGV